MSNINIKNTLYNNLNKFYIIKLEKNKLQP